MGDNAVQAQPYRSGMRFDAVDKQVYRRSPHGDVLLADCYTSAWASTIAELLNRDDTNMVNPVMT
jgi:hypothetical protein